MNKGRVCLLLHGMFAVICFTAVWLISYILMTSIYTCTHTHTNAHACVVSFPIFQGRPRGYSLMVSPATHCCLYISGRHFPVFCTWPCTFIFFLLNYKWINILNRFSSNPPACFNLPHVLFLVLKHDREWGEWTEDVPFVLGEATLNPQMGCSHSPQARDYKERFKKKIEDCSMFACV